MVDGYDAEIRHVGPEHRGKETEIHITTLPAIIDLRPSWWRHPIMRWRLRHLLPDMEAAEAELENSISPVMLARMRELEDDAFLNGRPYIPGAAHDPARVLGHFDEDVDR